MEVQFLARRHETGNILLPGVPTLSSFPILQQTNKTLVSLLSFKVDLTQKNMILSLAIETDRYGKMLFSKQEVKKYAGAVNYTAVSYRSWTVK